MFNLYLLGKTKVDSEMDIVKIMQRVRYHDIALKSSILNSKERKIQARFARKYMLEVDSDEESEDDYEMSPNQKRFDEVHEKMNLGITGVGIKSEQKKGAQNLARSGLALDHYDMLLKQRVIKSLRSSLSRVDKFGRPQQKIPAKKIQQINSYPSEMEEENFTSRGDLYTGRNQTLTHKKTAKGGDRTTTSQNSHINSQNMASTQNKLSTLTQT